MGGARGLVGGQVACACDIFLGRGRAGGVLFLSKPGVSVH